MVHRPLVGFVYVFYVDPTSPLHVGTVVYLYERPVLRIRDVYPGSRILIFTHPGSRISDPGPGSKNSNKRER